MDGLPAPARDSVKRDNRACDRRCDSHRCPGPFAHLVSPRSSLWISGAPCQRPRVQASLYLRPGHVKVTPYPTVQSQRC